jgi:uncharacterized membrane protein YgaE (UPF0421/DUF939 family)
LVQGTAAATAAWVIAKQVVDHHEPLFAPIAAVIALNAPLGERGLNALRLLLGVVLGIVAGELATLALGGGYGALALATFAAMSVAQAAGGARITIAQAAAGAILTVAVADGHAGPDRLVDAMIGAGVALVFSQLLFAPEPVALLRRAEASALAEMADGLELTARSLERDDDELGERALSRLRHLRDRLAELGRTRDAERPSRAPLRGLALSEEARGAGERERRPSRPARRELPDARSRRRCGGPSRARQTRAAGSRAGGRAR